MTQLYSLEDIALSNQLEPIGNVVVYRTFPFAIWVSASNAAMRLLSHLVAIVGLVYLNELVLAFAHGSLFRIATRNIEKLEFIAQSFFHFAHLNYCGAARVRSSRSLRLAALGLTSQN